jgi:hypothetical protein
MKHQSRDAGRPCASVENLTAVAVCAVRGDCMARRKSGATDVAEDVAVSWRGPARQPGSSLSDPPRRRRSASTQIGRAGEEETAFTTNVPRALRRVLRHHCAETGTSIHDFLIAAIRERLARPQGRVSSSLGPPGTRGTIR